MAGRYRATSTLPYLMGTLGSKESIKPAYRGTLPSLRRAFSLYDQTNLIDNVPDDQLRFQGYTDTGFTVNGANYEGSLITIGNLILSWTMSQLIRPIPEILLLGTGRQVQHVDPELRCFVRSTGMKLEAIDSRNTASTFNILNEEGRIVAAALLPHGVSS
ncbi:hypothetical protein MKX01_017351 [Papaver californicum]|nr:hypothetical protein MKX01_017351 [Papaver californicum]